MQNRKTILSALLLAASVLFLFLAGRIFPGAAKQMNQPGILTEAEEDSGAEPSFFVDFLDVDQGDASLVVSEGHAMLIDGGRAGRSDKIYAVLQEKGIDHLDYIVATHPDDDHVGGLSGALHYASVDMALSPVSEDDSQVFQDFLRFLDAQGVSVTVPEAGAKYALGDSLVTVLGPVETGSNDNNNSLVLKVEHGESSILFAGDAQEEEERSILASGADVKSRVLKVSHHGSASSTTGEWLLAVSPETAVISCGSGNAYGHPSGEVLERLRERGVQVLRTDLQGDAVLRENGQELEFGVQRNADADVYAAGIIPLETEPDVMEKDPAPRGPDPVLTDYIVNTNTGRFHYPECRSVKRMKEKNKSHVTCERQDLIDRGYSPCGNCHP